MGVHYRWELPEIVRTQLRLAHDAREDMVSMELAYDDELRAMWSSYPAVAAAEAVLEQAETAAAAAAEKVTAERIRLQSKRIGCELPAQLAQARAVVKAARQVRRDAISAVRVETTQRRDDLLAALRAAQRALYARYCKELGLYWATFNDVANHHRIAVARVMRSRREGRPAMLRHHRFDGTGTLAVQMQRRTGAPPRTPEVLADPHGRYSHFLVLPWVAPHQWAAMGSAERRRAGRVSVRMLMGNVDGQPQWIDVPVQAHRWLPSDADVGMVRLTVSRTAARLSARVLIAARIEPAQPAVAGAAVAVHLGWRDTEEGTRVASWRSTQPLVVPAALSSVLVADEGGLTGRIIVPRIVSQRLDRHAATAAVRDEALNAVRDRLVAWLVEHGPVAYRDGELGAEDVRRWRSPARFAALSIAWRDNPPGDIAAVLDAWRSADRKRWDGQEHGQRRALGYRDDLYRQVAAVFSGHAEMIAVDDVSIARIARSSSGDEEMSAELRQIVDRRRFRAAPGKLREAIVAAAQRGGVRCEVVSAKGLSRIHADCGHENPADERYASPPVACEGCGVAYDPDSSATLVMLRRAVGM